MSYASMAQKSSGPLAAGRPVAPLPMVIPRKSDARAASSLRRAFESEDFRTLARWADAQIPQLLLHSDMTRFLLHLEEHRYPVSLERLIKSLHLILLYEVAPLPSVLAYIQDVAEKQLADMMPSEHEEFDAALAARTASGSVPGSALVAFVQHRHLSNIQRVFVRILPLWKQLAARPDAAKSAKYDIEVLQMMRKVAGGVATPTVPLAGTKRPELEDEEGEVDYEGNGATGATSAAAGGSPPASSRVSSASTAASASSSADADKSSRVTLSDASGQDEHFEKISVMVRVCHDRPQDVRMYSGRDGSEHAFSELCDPRKPWPQPQWQRAGSSSGYGGGAGSPGYRDSSSSSSYSGGGGGGGGYGYGGRPSTGGASGGDVKRYDDRGGYGGVASGGTYHGGDRDHYGGGSSYGGGGYSRDSDRDRGGYYLDRDSRGSGYGGGTTTASRDSYNSSRDSRGSYSGPGPSYYRDSSNSNDYGRDSYGRDSRYYYDHRDESRSRHGEGYDRDRGTASGSGSRYDDSRGGYYTGSQRPPPYPQSASHGSGPAYHGPPASSSSSLAAAALAAAAAPPPPADMVTADDLPAHYRRYSAPAADITARIAASPAGSITWFCIAEEWRRGGPKTSLDGHGDLLFMGITPELLSGIKTAAEAVAREAKLPSPPAIEPPPPPPATPAVNGSAPSSASSASGVVNMSPASGSGPGGGSAGTTPGSSSSSSAPASPPLSAGPATVPMPIMEPFHPLLPTPEHEGTVAVAARYLKGSMLLQAVESKYINFAASGVNAAKRRERHRKKLDEQAREYGGVLAREMKNDPLLRPMTEGRVTTYAAINGSARVDDIVIERHDIASDAELNAGRYKFAAPAAGAGGQQPGSLPGSAGTATSYDGSGGGSAGSGSAGSAGGQFFNSQSSYSGGPSGGGGGGYGPTTTSRGGIAMGMGLYDNRQGVGAAGGRTHPGSSGYVMTESGPQLLVDWKAIFPDGKMPRQRKRAKLMAMLEQEMRRGNKQSPTEIMARLARQQAGGDDDK